MSWRARGSDHARGSHARGSDHTLGNPVRAHLVEHPAAWPWSSFPGYARRDRRLEWMAYDELLASWRGEFGGADPAGSYRRYVTAGLAEPPATPWSEAHHGWALGGPEFLARLRRLVREDPPRERRREAREVQAVDLRKICEVVCRAYGIEESELGRRGSRQEARAALAYLARRHTAVANSALAEALGVGRADSVPNLTRRFAARLAESKDVRERLARLEGALHRSVGPADGKTANLV